MKKLILTEPGYAQFTGDFCGVPFVDGLSTRVVMDAEQLRIGSILRCEHFDDEAGESTGVQAGVGQLLLDAACVAAVVETSLESDLNSAPAPAPTAPTAPADLYTEEQLSEIATANGIAGLRPIGDKLGVRGNSISSLIAKILKAQGNATPPAPAASVVVEPVVPVDAPAPEEAPAAPAEAPAAPSEQPPASEGDQA